MKALQALIEFRRYTCMCLGLFVFAHYRTVKDGRTDMLQHPHYT